MQTTDKQEQAFRAAFEDFYRAGMRLVEAWDDGEGWNADERFPLPRSLAPPQSLDEWLMNLREHYDGFAQQDMSEVN